MNKKIYYNDKFIEVSEYPAQITGNQSLEVVNHNDLTDKELKKLMADFLDEGRKKSYKIVDGDFKKFVSGIRPQFNYIEAAGGFIENRGKYLFIFRHNRWDLPKGKFEKNETREQCAVRECEEECGIRQLEISHKLRSTWHIYPHKGSFALKQTFWFYMQTKFDGKLRPQLDEDITQVRWFTEAEIRSVALKNTYYTISDVVNEALSS